ncbi:MAG: hypothetical protein JRJ69_02540 [Deltaproteobacteria bacterium]|nr:hypothetical protein [Deltaproteobacteria bacterium]MBW1736446.1 hypothetical protein [Deltaproteobacteria bacterium]MBW1909101.1 hypothetical protein [Deltaproteobacteria bacterium]MBW2032175.1 hypothetical protein [Deltaproteobacteria bacterium]MBW2113817.1 hypothetical protein [Deltaproteobacteria bacterium]
MLKSGSFSHLEKTLEKAQGLMEKIVEQNEQWQGGGAFEEDILRAGNLLKEAQTGLVEIGDTFIRSLSQTMDVDVKAANDVLDQAYYMLNPMYHDTKEIRISLKRGESQTKAIKDLEIHLKQFVKHCEETRSYLFNAVNNKKKRINTG